MEREFGAGQRDVVKLRDAGYTILARDPEVRVDYFEIVDPATLEPAERIAGRTLVAVAAYVGSTRLIDNILLVP